MTEEQILLLVLLFAIGVFAIFVTSIQLKGPSVPYRFSSWAARHTGYADDLSLSGWQEGYDDAFIDMENGGWIEGAPEPEDDEDEVIDDQDGGKIWETLGRPVANWEDLGDFDEPDETPRTTH